MIPPDPQDGSLPRWTVDLPPEIEPVPEEAPAEAERRPTAAPVTTDETPPPLPRLIEALLFVGGAPLTAERAAEVIRGLTAEHYLELLEELNRTYRHQGRPYRIAAVEGGHALVLQARYREVLQRLHGGTRETRLMPPVLDTLAIVAYKEPLTREEIDAVRGADSSGPLRQLVRLGLVALERQTGETPGVVYRTTGKFLALFGLQSRDDLPRTHDPQQL